MTRILVLTTLLWSLILPVSMLAQGKSAPAGPDPQMVEKIEKAGGRVMAIAQNDDRLEIDFHLQSADVTDQSLACLDGLKKVYSLNLGKTKITDAGLAHVAGLTSLNRFYLQETKINDKGLTHLKNLHDLVYLNLYGTAVTDQGLEHLAGLTNLKNLYVWQSKVTDAGIAKLKKSLPNVNIVSGTEPEPKK
ncbi:MAG: hypothetical protein U0V70_14115 [Terriglobia bacterium]